MKQTKIRMALVAATVFGTLAAAAFEYNVRMPSTAACPRWRGARVGEWTMDYEAARAQAVAEGRGLILLPRGHGGARTARRSRRRFCWTMRRSGATLSRNAATTS